MAWPQQPEQIGKLVVTVLDALARGHARLLETSVTDLGALATKQAEVTLDFDWVAVAETAKYGADLSGVRVLNPMFTVETSSTRETNHATIKLTVVQVPYSPRETEAKAGALIGRGIVRGGNEAAGALAETVREGDARLSSAAVAHVAEALARAAPKGKDGDAPRALAARLDAVASLLAGGDRAGAEGSIALLTRAEKLLLARLRAAAKG
ncbi:hypothetical protein [Elioraea sp.]|uniref:hypothetical protein n=1 Tax=Elioraea sp. TaxID=2185103 RepID=UPI0025C33C2E|nr:hypothetical protein [Elioraea sp.]